jgi:hypothetical protein
MRLRLNYLAFVVVAFCCAQAIAQTPAAAPASGANSDATYQELRRVGLGGEAIAVNNLQIKRDAGTFLFRSGTFCFATPVNGHITGAVFNGDGRFNLDPPTEIEKRQLKVLTKSNEPLSEDFSQLVLRFTDATYDEIKKAATQGGISAGCSGGLDDINNVYRRDYHYNIAARLLQDVLAPKPIRGGYFGALIKGKHYSSKELYLIDPYGVFMEASGMEQSIYRFAHGAGVAPEEVAFVTFEGNKDGTWTAFHFSEEYRNGTASGGQRSWPIHIEQQKLKTKIEKNTRLEGNAETTFVSTYDGLRVVPFNLFASLRVKTVTDSNGAPLPFIQEERNDDPQYAVILPRPLAAGERFSVRTTYEGKDAVWDTGGGNFFPVAREDWYPSSSFGDYANYEMEFRIPKGMTMVATGGLVKQFNEGEWVVSQWKTDAVQAVAGFNFGKFNKKELKLDKLNGFLVQSYANTDVPDMVQNARDAENDPAFIGHNVTFDRAVGSLSTTANMDKPLVEAQMAMGLYTAYFGPVTYKNVAVTQQTSCGFGQSWPTLVYLPMCAFYDSTQRHAFHMDDVKGQFWEIVGPHEMAHQWWGHLVGFNSYRDQWMSEGFAEFSASIFIQAVYGKTEPDRYMKFWNRERELLTQRNAQGFRAIDFPLTLGYRSNTTQTGNITFSLIYPKGAYILHMIRMMMWNDAIANHDQAFQALMHDFTKTYTDRIATTEDFKAMVEKHMTDQMDLDGNHRMDWFFNEYVYGTALPAYKLEYSFKDQGGTPVLSFRITQSNVDKDFKMLIPLYAQAADNRIVRLGSANITGNSSFSADVPLTGVKQMPKKVMIDYYYDVLATDAK